MRPTAPPDYPDDPVAEPVHKGRGALSNETSRYDTEKRIRTTDGWDAEVAAVAEDDPAPLIQVAEAAAVGEAPVLPSGPLAWLPEAERELRKIPFFVRGKARRNTELYARDKGLPSITLETLYDAKAHFSR